MVLAACRSTGGLEERGVKTIRRVALSTDDRGESVACGDAMARGTGSMLGSALRLQPSDTWEETGLLGRVSRLEEFGDRRHERTR